ncbi:MAG: hypothetical protein AAGU21_12590 [Solidesulfovibrio sp.]|uniref:hypothetical protein n=1 Tax=Solidesulfovibrio sp. TaxID=2910990 RepID=UPI002B200DA7|nr:hypothetical protein [Solidesulfovibrio sp.]MEA4855667.1 hypothetical protein [Solidesulfovibrio sp.]
MTGPVALPEAWEAGRDRELPGALTALLPGAPRRLSRLGGGRNSAVYLAECGARGTFVVKAYAPPGPGGRDRLEVECAALRFLEAASPPEDPAPAPRLVAACPQAHLAVHAYRPGTAVTAPDARDVDLALAFVARLRALSGHPLARALPPAAEAAFDPAALGATLARRFEALAAVADDAPQTRAMRRFLDDELRPLAQAALARAATAFPASGPLPQSERVLSPSDFGFHNARRTPDGGLVFLDFEYFGWDDPAKLGADFLLHPAMGLTPALGRRFARGLCARFGPSLAGRLAALGPVYAVKWCLILLNEFTAQGLARRRLSGCRQDRAAVLRAQLTKAGRLAALARSDHVARCLDDGPDRP